MPRWLSSEQPLRAAGAEEYERQELSRRAESAPRTGRPTVDLFASKNVLEELQRPRVARLTEPEHRLTPDLGIPVGAGHVDHLRYALVLRHLAEREDGLLLDLGVGIVIDRVRDGLHRLRTGALGDPEQRVATQAWVLARARQRQETIECRWIAMKRDRDDRLVLQTASRLTGGEAREPIQARCRGDTCQPPHRETTGIEWAFRGRELDAIDPAIGNAIEHIQRVRPFELHRAAAPRESVPAGPAAVVSSARVRRDGVANPHRIGRAGDERVELAIERSGQRAHVERAILY